MNFPPYEGYRESGHGWLGRVPEHWRAGPIRLFARLASGHTPSRQHPEYWENCCIPWFTLADVSQLRSGRVKYVYETKETISELGLENSAARVLPAGTVMLSRTASVGFSAIMGRDMATTQDFANWVCGVNLRPEFLLASLHAMGQEFRRLMMGSTHQTIYMPDIAQLAISIPPLQEQDAIVIFLDRETSKIDALIVEQTRLIELWKEKRQAVIAHAVTKGLDPEAPMRESGLAWPLEIPSHWQVLSLNRVVETFVDYRGATPTKVSSGVPLITASQLKNGRIDHSLDPVFISETEYADRMTRGLPERGDVLLTTEAPLGETAQVEEKRIAPGQRIILMKPNLQFVKKDYLFTHFQSLFGQTQLRMRASGSTALGIRADRLRGSPVIVPSLREQAEIVAHIRDRIAAFDQIEAVALATISLLQERRSALISAAVTGKIDVRGLVPERSEAA